jgi:hypothetical protein
MGVKKLTLSAWNNAVNGGVSKTSSSRTGTSGLQTQLIRLTGTLEAIMDTVLFTDHGIVVFAITCSAMALILSVLGLATPHQTRSDINRELKGLPWEAERQS